MTQNIDGHRRYTAHLLEAELSRRDRGLPGPGSAADLRALYRQVVLEARSRRPYDYTPHEHPAKELISSWPSEHPLTVALQAIVDYAWRPIEFAPGGRYQFPEPESEPK